MPGRSGFGGGGGGGGNFGGNRSRGVITDPEHEQFRKLFIGGLSYDTTEETLKGHFEQWGEIVDCVVMKDPSTKRSRGFGFITYDKSAMIEDAQANRPHKIDGREVETKRAMPREESGQSESQQSVKKMFVGGLKEGTTEEQVRECFDPFGTIEKVDMIADKNTGKTRGFCFVVFEDYDMVDKCVLKKRFSLNDKDVEVKKAVSKSDQQNQRGPGGGGRGGMRGGGYSGGGGGGFNEGGFGGQGGFSGQGGGFGGGGFGGGGGGYQGGGGGYGGGGGGYGGGGGGSGYNNQGGGNWGGQNFGSNYGDNYGGGAMKGGGYNQRGQGPYGGGGYGGGGGGYGGGGGGGYGGGNRR